MAGSAELQARIDALLREPADEPPTAFSPYTDSARDVVDALWSAASEGDDAEAAMTRVLELAETAAASSDRRRVRHALELFLTHHPRARELDLRVAPLVERAPHLTWPKDRTP